MLITKFLGKDWNTDQRTNNGRLVADDHVWETELDGPYDC